MKNYSQWYENNYPFLSDHGIWLRGDEFNTLPAEDYFAKEFRFLITRLSTYRDTAASFSHTLLYQIAASVENIFPDLAYLPPPKDSACFDRDSIPWLLGTKTKAGPDAFDCIGFSLSIVQELINLPTVLRKSAIPLQKSQRLAQPNVPLIILGGASACASSLLWTQDPLVDGIYMGHDTQAIRSILETCRDAKKNTISKHELLTLLERIPGFIQPEHIDTSSGVSSQKTAPIALEQCTNLPVLYDDDCYGTGHIQITSGCPFFCSFCFESWMRKPYRETPSQEIIDQALAIKKSRGCSSIELYSFNFNVHKDILPLFSKLSSLFEKVRMKSQRFDFLAKSPRMITYLHAIGKTSVTCALEGISWRLRKYLDKNLDYNDLLQSTTLLIRSATRELKIFLIATGLETDKDFEEFRDYLDFIKKECQSAGRFPRIIFSITPLVRFPMTPLMFEDGCTSQHLTDTMRTMTATIRAMHFECRNAMEAPEYWLSQVFVRARERTLVDILIKTLEETGYIFYRDVPSDFITVFQKNCLTTGIEPDSLLVGIDAQQNPWQQINVSSPAQAILDRYTDIKEYRAYVPAMVTEPDQADVIDRYSFPDQTTETPEQLRAKISEQQSQEERIHFLVVCDGNLRGTPRPLAGAILASALMQNDDSLTPLYRGFRGSLWQQDKKVWLEGEDVLTLAFAPPARRILEKLILDPDFFNTTSSLTQGKIKVLSLINPKELSFTYTITSPFPINEQGYFANKSLKFTRIKNDDHNYAFVFSKDARKKNIIDTFLVNKLATGSIAIALTPGKKFNLTEFIQSAFHYPTPDDWVRVRVMNHCVTSPANA